MNTLIIIKYDNNKTIIVKANTIHPAILQEIETYGCADYMFDDGTFATLSFVKRDNKLMSHGIVRRPTGYNEFTYM